MYWLSTGQYTWQHIMQQADRIRNCQSTAYLPLALRCLKNSPPQLYSMTKYTHSSSWKQVNSWTTNGNLISRNTSLSALRCSVCFTRYILSDRLMLLEWQAGKHGTPRPDCQYTCRKMGQVDSHITVQQAASCRLALCRMLLRAGQHTC